MTWDATQVALSRVEIPPNEAGGGGGQLDVEYTLVGATQSPRDISIAASSVGDLVPCYIEPVSAVVAPQIYWNIRPLANPAWWRVYGLVRGDTAHNGRVRLATIILPPNPADPPIQGLGLDFNQQGRLIDLFYGTEFLLTRAVAPFTDEAYYHIGLEAIGGRVRLYFNPQPFGDGATEDENSMSVFGEAVLRPDQITTLPAYLSMHFGGTSAPVKSAVRVWVFYDLQPQVGSGSSGGENPTSPGPGSTPPGGYGPSPVPALPPGVTSGGPGAVASQYNTYKSIRKAVSVYNNLSLGN